MKIDFISDINKDNYYILDYDRIDLYMIKIAWWNAAFFALYAFGIYYFAPAALYPSPFSWRVVNLTETLWTVAIALFAAFLPAVLVLFMAIVTTKTCEQNRQLADASRLIGDDFKKI